MNNGTKITRTYDGPPLRADKALPLMVDGLTRSAAAALMEAGGALLDGVPLPKNRLLKSGDTVTLLLPDAEESAPAPEEIPLDIIYEDAHLLVVNKPAGMVVHPAPGNRTGTLCSALLAHCGGQLSTVGDPKRPGIVHRIDKDTSGLLIAAKTDAAHLHLAAQIKSHSFLREYEAVAYGRIRNDSGTIDAPVGRHPKKRKQMSVVRGGREAITHYKVLTRYGDYTHLLLRLQTGRTHQIRVHLAHLGHPVAGDPVYGGKRKAPGLKFQCLHASRIGFIHPATEEYLEFSSPLPDWFAGFLKRIGPSDAQGIDPSDSV